MLKTFIAEYCQMSLDSRVAKADLYEAYLQWEKSHARQPLSINEIGRQMKGLDFGEARTKNTRFWTGLRLSDPSLGLGVVPISEAAPLIPPISQSGATCNSSTMEAELSVVNELDSPTSPDSSARLTYEDALNERIKRDLLGAWKIQKF